MFSIIACISKVHRAIGYKNRLLYAIPSDMTRFRMLTTGHTIIMGRKTFESLPNGALPNRRNIVISKTKEQITGCWEKNIGNRANNLYPQEWKIKSSHGTGELFIVNSL